VGPRKVEASKRQGKFGEQKTFDQKGKAGPVQGQMFQLAKDIGK
jgi:hypothetical protein